MELETQLDSIIKKLEDIQNLRDQDIDIVRKKVDDIENKILPELDERFEDMRNQIYNEDEPNEAEEKSMNQVENRFIEAYTLINAIHEQFGWEYDEDYDELTRLPLDYGEEDDDANDETDEYVIVLNEVSKSALRAIGLNDDDDQFIKLMGTILIGISSNESDAAIAGKAFAQLAVSGFMLPMDQIKELCKDVREKCKGQLFGLQIAFNSLQEYNCSAADALLQIQFFL